jgi:hypothetical protein
VALHFVVKDSILGIYAEDIIAYFVDNSFMVTHLIGVLASQKQTTLGLLLLTYSLNEQVFT